MAAVICIDGKMFYTDCAPEARIVEQFKPRADNQIASLEMLAIAYGERRRRIEHMRVMCVLCRLVNFSGYAAPPQHSYTHR